MALKYIVVDVPLVEFQQQFLDFGLESEAFDDHHIFLDEVLVEGIVHHYVRNGEIGGIGHMEKFETIFVDSEASD